MRLLATEWTLLQQGAEARVYTGLFLGQKSILKHRFPKEYRHVQLDKRLRSERVRSEIRALIKAKMADVTTPTLLFADENEGIIVMEDLQCAKTSKSLIETWMNDGGKEQKILYLASLIGSTVGKLHSRGLIHGDLTTSNLLFNEQKNELIIIDFGLGSQEGSFEEKAVDLYVLERALVTTHSKTKKLFEVVLQAYGKANANQVTEVRNKLEEVRARGRKRTMVG